MYFLGDSVISEEDPDCQEKRLRYYDEIEDFARKDKDWLAVTWCENMKKKVLEGNN